MEHDPTRYGDAFADVYDEWYSASFDTPSAVRTLTDLAHRAHRARTDGSAGPPQLLELGVGTGRLAIPLAATGLAVIGLDGSPRMLERLAAADRQRSVVAVEGDMAECGAALASVRPPGGFDLAVCAFNTLFNLETAALQSRCLTGVAELLAPTGMLVIEAAVPGDPSAMPAIGFGPAQVSAARPVTTATHHDPDRQTIVGRHVEHLDDGHVHLRPWTVRYLSPEQLDHMATESGFELVARWSNWQQGPFDDTSETHISVLRLP